MTALELTSEEARDLRDLLADYLPQLRLETARTEVRSLHRAMLERQALCERVLARLEAAVPAATGGTLAPARTPLGASGSRVGE